MFILYAIPIGIVAGYLLGGRLDRLAALRFEWALGNSMLLTSITGFYETDYKKKSGGEKKGSADKGKPSCPNAGSCGGCS